MGWFTGIVVFLLVWWMMLFTVLPFGHLRDINGTSVDPQIKKKMIITSVIAGIVWCIIYVLIDADLVSFREMARVAAEKEAAL